MLQLEKDIVITLGSGDELTIPAIICLEENKDITTNCHMEFLLNKREVLTLTNYLDSVGQEEPYIVMDEPEISGKLEFKKNSIRIKNSHFNRSRVMKIDIFGLFYKT